MHNNGQLRISRHAQKRSQQRAIPHQILELILVYGCQSKARDGATEIFLGNKECAEIITYLKGVMKTIERAKGGTVIICGDTVVTAYKKN